MLRRHFAALSLAALCPVPASAPGGTTVFATKPVRARDDGSGAWKGGADSGP